MTANLLTTLGVDTATVRTFADINEAAEYARQTLGIQAMPCELVPVIWETPTARITGFFDAEGVWFHGLIIGRGDGHSYLVLDPLA